SPALLRHESRPRGILAVSRSASALLLQGSRSYTRIGGARLADAGRGRPTWRRAVMAAEKNALARPRRQRGPARCRRPRAHPRPASGRLRARTVEQGGGQAAQVVLELAVALR